MHSSRSLWLPLSACAAFLFFVYFAAAPIINQTKSVLFSPLEPYDDLIKSQKKNVWADLSPDEAREVKEFVLSSSSSLNLTENSKASR
jgi:hypothetical protein